MPNVSGDAYLSRGERSTTRYFNTSVFSTPPQDVKGNAGIGAAMIRGGITTYPRGGFRLDCAPFL